MITFSKIVLIFEKYIVKYRSERKKERERREGRNKHRWVIFDVNLFYRLSDLKKLIKEVPHTFYAELDHKRKPLWLQDLICPLISKARYFPQRRR